MNKSDLSVPNLLNTILVGDCRELGQLIPDESVHLCICDPVYWEIWQYEWLGEICRRVLVPGGNALAQCGTLFLYEAAAAMAKNLTYVWTMAEILTGGHAPVWVAKVYQGWKPYLWFTKGRPIDRLGKYVFDRQEGGGRNKSTHVWGDSDKFTEIMIARLTSSGEVVFDPFTGSGTVPRCCKRLGRNYIAFEIDIDRATLALESVQNTQVPIITVDPIQPELMGMEIQDGPVESADNISNNR